MSGDPRGPAWRRVFSGQTCGWPGCDKFVSGRLWACREHWLQLPVEIRDRMMSCCTSGPSWSRVRSAAFPIAEAEALHWIEENFNAP